MSDDLIEIGEPEITEEETIEFILMRKIVGNDGEEFYREITDGRGDNFSYGSIEGARIGKERA